MIDFWEIRGVTFDSVSLLFGATSAKENVASIHYLLGLMHIGVRGKLQKIFKQQLFCSVSFFFLGGGGNCVGRPGGWTLEPVGFILVPLGGHVERKVGKMGVRRAVRKEC